MPVISLFGGAGNGAGFNYQLDLSATTDADPGAGKIRFNHATLSSVTEIYVSKTDLGQNNIGENLKIYDDFASSGVRATLSIGSVPSPNSLVQYNLTDAITDATTYLKFTVTHLGPDTDPTFANGQSVAFGGIPTGQQGAQGDPGDPGAQGAMSGILYTFDTTTTDSDPGSGMVRTSRASWTPGQTGFIYADNLDANGNSVALFVQTFDDSDSTPKGGVGIINTTDTSEFLAFAITGDITVASGYDKIPVQYVAGSGSITNAASVAVDPKYTGDKGEPGVGMRMSWSTATTDSDPGAGYIGANNATLASATALYVNDADLNGVDLTAWLGTWDDSTNPTVKGDVWIKDKADTDKWLTAEVTAVTDDGDYFDITIQNVVSGGTAFVVDDNVAVSFMRAGDKGTDGAGAGDIVGPASATDNAIVRYDSTTGKLVQNSAGILDDSGNLSGINNITVSGTVDGRDVATDGTKLDGIEAGADVTDTANVTAAGALMDSEVDADIKTLSLPASTTISTYGASLIDDADAGTARTTLGLGTAAVLAETTAAEFRNNTADRALSTDQVWSAAAEVTLTDAASITVDMDSFINAVVTLGGNRTLANPTNEKVGQSGHIRVVQDGTGSRTLAFGTDYEFAGGTAPTLTTTASAEDMLFYKVIAANRILITSVLDLS